MYIYKTTNNLTGQFYIGQASKGEKNGFYGKTHLEETRVKIKEAVKGKILSEEHKNKIGKASKEAWKKRKQNV